MPELSLEQRQIVAYGAVFIYFIIFSVFAHLLGIAKCWSIARRPTTNAKCVMGLLLFLVGSLALSLGPLLFGRPAFMLLISFAINMAAVVIAILGLQEYSRSRGRYKQGRAQAIWALNLSALPFVAVLLLLANGRWHFLGEPNQNTGKKRVVREDRNFQFFAPGGRWCQVNTNKPYADAALMLRCAEPPMHYVILAETSPPTSKIDSLTRTATNNLSHAFPTVRILYQGPTRVGPVEGTRLHSQAAHSGEKIYLEHRLLSVRGWAYQLVAWGSQRDESVISQEAAEMARRFEILHIEPTSYEETEEGRRLKEILDNKP